VGVVAAGAGQDPRPDVEVGRLTVFAEKLFGCIIVEVLRHHEPPARR
jgi:hypothetical protein